MGFGNKDLLTKLLPRFNQLANQIIEVCALRSNICRSPTYVQLFARCGDSMVTGVTTVPLAQPIAFIDQADLESIRHELSETVRQLDHLAKEGLPSRITTREEANDAEQLLLKQLEVVRKAKQGLE